jgi:hypothetical protein
MMHLKAAMYVLGKPHEAQIAMYLFKTTENFT